MTYNLGCPIDRLDVVYMTTCKQWTNVREWNTCNILIVNFSINDIFDILFNVIPVSKLFLVWHLKNVYKYVV